MTGQLLHAPTEAELARLYHELSAWGAPSVGAKAAWPYAPKGFEQLITLAAEMLRYDARLLSILLELLLKRWKDIDPLKLREAMRSMAWPQALLVVLEFAREANRDPELRYFCDYLSAGCSRMMPSERIFFEGERPGSRVAKRRGHRSLTAYSRWGFLGTERPSTSATRKTRVGRYDAPTRRRIRRQLAERRGSFTMQQYLAALDHGVTRQQAYEDLRRDAALEVRGHGRGAKWHPKNE